MGSEFDLASDPLQVSQKLSKLEHASDSPASLALTADHSQTVLGEATEGAGEGTEEPVQPAVLPALPDSASARSPPLPPTATRGPCPRCGKQFQYAQNYELHISACREPSPSVHVRPVSQPYRSTCRATPPTDAPVPAANPTVSAVPPVTTADPLTPQSPASAAPKQTPAMLSIANGPLATIEAVPVASQLYAGTDSQPWMAMATSEVRPDGTKSIMLVNPALGVARQARFVPVSCATGGPPAFKDVDGAGHIETVPALVCLQNQTAPVTTVTSGQAPTIVNHTQSAVGYSDRPATVPLTKHSGTTEFQPPAYTRPASTTFQPVTYSPVFTRPGVSAPNQTVTAMPKLSTPRSIIQSVGSSDQVATAPNAFDLSGTAVTSRPYQAEPKQNYSATADNHRTSPSYPLQPRQRFTTQFGNPDWFGSSPNPGRDVMERPHQTSPPVIYSHQSGNATRIPNNNRCTVNPPNQTVNHGLVSLPIQYSNHNMTVLRQTEAGGLVTTAGRTQTMVSSAGHESQVVNNTAQTVPEPMETVHTQTDYQSEPTDNPVPTAVNLGGCGTSAPSQVNFNIQLPSHPIHAVTTTNTPVTGQNQPSKTVIVPTQADFVRLWNETTHTAGAATTGNLPDYLSAASSEHQISLSVMTPDQAATIHNNPSTVVTIPDDIPIMLHQPGTLLNLTATAPLQPNGSTDRAATARNQLGSQACDQTWLPDHRVVSGSVVAQTQGDPFAMDALAIVKTESRSEPDTDALLFTSVKREAAEPERESEQVRQHADIVVKVLSELLPRDDDRSNDARSSGKLSDADVDADADSDSPPDQKAYVMWPCDECGREFRSNSGLSSHRLGRRCVRPAEERRKATGSADGRTKEEEEGERKPAKDEQEGADDEDEASSQERTLRKRPGTLRPGLRSGRSAAARSPHGSTSASSDAESSSSDWRRRRRATHRPFASRRQHRGQPSPVQGCHVIVPRLQSTDRGASDDADAAREAEKTAVAGASLPQSPSQAHTLTDFGFVRRESKGSEALPERGSQKPQRARRGRGRGRGRGHPHRSTPSTTSSVSHAQSQDVTERRRSDDAVGDPKSQISALPAKEHGPRISSSPVPDTKPSASAIQTRTARQASMPCPKSKKPISAVSDSESQPDSSLQTNTSHSGDGASGETLASCPLDADRKRIAHHRCITCGRQFAQEKWLKTHQRHHTRGRLTVSCSHCNWAFLNESFVSRHKRTDECPFPNRPFSLRPVLILIDSDDDDPPQHPPAPSNSPPEPAKPPPIPAPSNSPPDPEKPPPVPALSNSPPDPEKPPPVPAPSNSPPDPEKPPPVPTPSNSPPDPEKPPPVPAPSNSPPDPEKPPNTQLEPPKSPPRRPGPRSRQKHPPPPVRITRSQHASSSAQDSTSASSQQACEPDNPPTLTPEQTAASLGVSAPVADALQRLQRVLQPQLTELPGCARTREYQRRPQAMLRQQIEQQKLQRAAKRHASAESSVGVAGQQGAVGPSVGTPAAVGTPTLVETPAPVTRPAPVETPAPVQAPSCPFQCPLCGADTMDTLEFTEHVLMMHSGRSLECLKCGMKFPSLSSFVRHRDASLHETCATATRPSQ